ncbi:MAG: hypothetical protein NZM38_03330 [Cytophagales bacterium]|nr:hypothetical protein [Cytophagales bacterium]MDW8383786.1 hypothetical protein [Flammeovirgaceae bacterium]
MIKKLAIVGICLLEWGIVKSQYVREDDTTYVPSSRTLKQRYSQNELDFKHFAGILLGNSLVLGSLTDTNLYNPKAGFAIPAGSSFTLVQLNFRLQEYWGVGGSYGNFVFSHNSTAYAKSFLQLKGHNPEDWRIRIDQPNQMWGSVHLIAGLTGYIPLEKKIVMVPKVFWGASVWDSPEIAFSAARQNTHISYVQRSQISESAWTLNVGSSFLYFFSKRFALNGTCNIFYSLASFGRWEATVQTETTQSNRLVLQTEKFVIPQRTMSMWMIDFSVGIVYRFVKNSGFDPL